MVGLGCCWDQIALESLVVRCNKKAEAASCTSTNNLWWHLIETRQLAHQVEVNQKNTITKSVTCDRVSIELTAKLTNQLTDHLTSNLVTQFDSCLPVVLLTPPWYPKGLSCKCVIWAVADVGHYAVVWFFHPAWYSNLEDVDNANIPLIGDTMPPLGFWGRGKYYSCK